MTSAFAKVDSQLITNQSNSLHANPSKKKLTSVVASCNYKYLKTQKVIDGEM